MYNLAEFIPCCPKRRFRRLIHLKWATGSRRHVGEPVTCKPVDIFISEIKYKGQQWLALPASWVSHWNEYNVLTLTRNDWRASPCSESITRAHKSSTLYSTQTVLSEHYSCSASEPRNMSTNHALRTRTYSPPTGQTTIGL